MVSILCDLEKIKGGLKKLICILDSKNLKSRNIDSDEIDILVDFLEDIYNMIEQKKIKDYSNFIFLLHSKTVDSRYKQIIYKKSFLIEAISILSVKDRINELKQYIENSLNRTNTNFSGDDLFRKIKNKFLEEFIESLAIYYSLRTIQLSGSSFAKIRFNVGNRSIEEYFAELISGWILEEYIILRIQEVIGENYIKRKGVDASRKILFGKIHGASDIHLSLDERNIHIEVQRIANSLKPGKKRQSEVSVLLKEHKIKNSDIILFVTNYNFLSSKLSKKSFYRNSLKEYDKNESILISVVSKSLMESKSGNNLYILPKEDDQILFFSLQEQEVKNFIEWLRRVL